MSYYNYETFCELVAAMEEITSDDVNEYEITYYTYLEQLCDEAENINQDYWGTDKCHHCVIERAGGNCEKLPEYLRIVESDNPTVQDYKNLTNKLIKLQIFFDKNCWRENEL